MYAYIKGKITAKNPEDLILENQGIGYRIFIGSTIMGRFPAIGEEAKVWLHFHVREDQMSFYGFVNLEEKSMFELLLTVGGIGPKVALSVVDQLSPEAFALAILEGDVMLLSSIKGIGKKSAERMILELKDKMKKEAKNLTSEKVEVPLTAEMLEGSDYALEAYHALLVLGYEAKEAQKAIALEVKQATTAEALIKLCFKHLS